MKVQIYKVKDKELREAFKSESELARFITTLCNKAIEDIYGIKDYYSLEEGSEEE